MIKGWIKIHRSLTESELYLSEPFCRNMAWIDMLILANHHDGKLRVRGHIIELKRGQLGWSKAALAGRWRWSRSKVQRFLGELHADGQIAQQGSNMTSLITILNYDEFQNSDPDDHTREKLHQNNTKKLSKKKKTSTHDDSTTEVLAYLNEKTGRNYKTSHGLTSRFQEGYSVADCKAVIDKKVADWARSEKMSAYLRPQTLFSNKFDSYLNEGRQPLTGDNEQLFKLAAQAEEID